MSNQCILDQRAQGHEVVFEHDRLSRALQPVGQKNPRIDLYLPSLHTIIEVKCRKDAKKSFATLIGEIAEDASLYRADPKYKDARIISFLWDSTRATQEHAKFKEGVLGMNGVDGCVVTSAPSAVN
ncbi:TPA: hypothetical protein QEL15_001950 [Stenotrophomonas maltophilia]|nr:hypothetical protein [Stenotrophomonas maltophilia]